jgi:protein-tyrosine-phosphatase
MNNILFICTGNICRSPTAEGFFRHHLARDFDPAAGIEIVPDPYYGHQSDFELVCKLLDGATRNLVGHLERGLSA